MPNRVASGGGVSLYDQVLSKVSAVDPSIVSCRLRGQFGRELELLDYSLGLLGSLISVMNAGEERRHIEVLRTKFVANKEDCLRRLNARRESSRSLLRLSDMQLSPERSAGGGGWADESASIAALVESVGETAVADLVTHLRDLNCRVYIVGQLPETCVPQVTYVQPQEGAFLYQFYDHDNKSIQSGSCGSSNLSETQWHELQAVPIDQPEQAISDDLYHAILALVNHPISGMPPPYLTPEDFEEVRRQVESKAGLTAEERSVLIKGLSESNVSAVLATVDEQVQRDQAGAEAEKLLPAPVMFEYDSAEVPVRIAIADGAGGLKTKEKLLEEIEGEIGAERTARLREDLQKVKQLIFRPSALVEGGKAIHAWGVDEIRVWAVKVKSDPVCITLHEKLAVLDRANEVYTYLRQSDQQRLPGHQLRQTQLCALLLFLHGYFSPGVGFLAEIATGEGKSTIIACLAVMKSLEGEVVDIVTSSPVLAERDADVLSPLYALFGLTVAHNSSDPDYIGGPRACYAGNIVYGSVENFQFDWLRDSYKGLKTRSGRGFGQVIVDEVDSMLIDNGGHIAKLATPLPGMELLLPLLKRLWVKLAEIEESNLSSLSELPDASAWGDVLQGASVAERKIRDINEAAWKEDILAYMQPIISTSTYLPPYLRKYAECQLSSWTDQAMHARYYCEKDRQYVLRKEQGEMKIVPVDYTNTGVLMQNTVWSDGLHQFVQMKEGLRLTAVSLSTAFISNLAYFKKYGAKLFGMTGTLGAEAERKLLGVSYRLNFMGIPTHKKQLLEIEPAVIASDEESWVKAIVELTAAVLEESRAVLIICETIAEAKVVLDAVRPLVDAAKLKQYLEASEVEVTNEHIDIGEVIVATYIAGRGTDILTTEAVEQNGGLFVSLAALAASARPEWQAVGRTARAGRRGTARLILNRAALSFGIASSSIEELKGIRDQLESERLQRVLEVRVPELDLADRLFAEFSAFYTAKSKAMKGDSTKSIVLDALEERWGLWLREQELNGFAGVEFSSFLELVEADQGQIINPYYQISLGNHWFYSRDFAKAQVAYEAAISYGGDTAFAAYYHMACLYIERGRQFEMQLLEIAGRLLPFLKGLAASRFSEYRVKAREYFQKARGALQLQMDRYEYIITPEAGVVVFSGELQEGAEGGGEKCSVYVKGSADKYRVLELYGHCVEQNIKYIDEHSGGSIVLAKRIHYAELMKKKSFQIDQQAYLEVGLLGLTHVVQLKTAPKIQKETVALSLAQIGSGLALLAAAMAVSFFIPGVLAAIGPVAGLLISEGVCDLVLEIVLPKDAEFNKKEFWTAKGISYGVGLATMGIGAILKAPRVLNYAIAKLQKYAAKLRRLGGFWQYVASALKKYAEKLGRVLEKVRKNQERMSKLTRYQRAQELVVKSGQKGLEKFLTDGVLPKLIKPLVKIFDSDIRQSVYKVIQKELDKVKLSCVIHAKQQDLLLKQAMDYLDLDPSKDFARALKEIGEGVGRYLADLDPAVKFIRITVEGAIGVDKCVNLARLLCRKLNEYMDEVVHDFDGEVSSVEIEDILHELADKATQVILDEINKHSCEVVKFAAERGAKAWKKRGEDKKAAEADAGEADAAAGGGGEAAAAPDVDAAAGGGGEAAAARANPDPANSRSGLNGAASSASMDVATVRSRPRRRGGGSGGRGARASERGMFGDKAKKKAGQKGKGKKKPGHPPPPPPSIYDKRTNAPGRKKTHGKRHPRSSAASWR